MPAEGLARDRLGTQVSDVVKGRRKRESNQFLSCRLSKKGDVLSCAVLALTVPLTKVFKQQTKDGKIWGKVPLT